MLRPVVLFVVLLALPTLGGGASAQSTEPGALVDIVRVEHPEIIVADKAFDLVVHLENRQDESERVLLFAALYAWEPGKACGSATDERFRSFTHTSSDATFTLAPRERTTYPREPGRDPSMRWTHVANASAVGEGGKMEICVFATEGPEASAPLTYFDYHNFTVTARPENVPPTVDFTFTPDVPNATMPVRFVATASDADGDLLSYRWEFGRFSAEGWASAVGPVATHAYYPDGTYTVNLVVSDGWDSVLVSKQIRVLPEDAPAELPPVGGSGDDARWRVPGPGALVALAALALALAARRMA